MPDTTIASASPEVTDREIEQVERALVDASARMPVLFFYSNSILWLIGSTVLGFIASVKFHHPNFLADHSWLTYGRVWPAFLNMLTYGWAFQAGFGTSLWLMARLCRVTMRNPVLPVFGGVFWNVGVTIGVVEILAGHSTGIEWLEFPRYVATLLFIGYFLVAIWMLIMFRVRRPGIPYITFWYLIAAYLCFPWLYATANYLIHNVNGVMQSVVAAWFYQGLLGFWFLAIGLGTIYYLIPKVIGRPIHSYHLASLGFWSFMLFWGWTGMTRFTGGPVPAWMSTVSIVATIMLIIPLATVTINYARTMEDHTGMVHNSPTIRFAFVGAIAYSLALVLMILTSLRAADRVTHFTQFQVGQSHLVIYSFFSMVIFGSMYYIVPRLVGCEWLSSTFIRLHFWCSAYGMGFMVFLLLLSGLAQGSAWLDPQQTTVDVLQYPLMYSRGRTFVAFPLLFIGHFVFALHYLAMLFRLGRPSSITPTLLHTAEEVH